MESILVSSHRANEYMRNQKSSISKYTGCSTDLAVTILIMPRVRKIYYTYLTYPHCYLLLLLDC